MIAKKICKSNCLVLILVQDYVKRFYIKYKIEE